MKYSTQLTPTQGKAYSDLVKSSMSYIKNMASTPYEEAVRVVGAGQDSEVTTMQFASDQASKLRGIFKGVQEAAKRWDEQTSQMSANDVALAIGAEQMTFEAIGYAYQQDSPGLSNLLLETASLLSMGRMELQNGLGEGTVSQVFSDSVDGLLARVLDGTPAAIIYGAANSIARAVVDKDLVQLLQANLTAALGDAASAIPIIGMFISAVTAFMDYTAKVGDEGRRVVISDANAIYRGEMDRLRELHSPRLSTGSGSLTRVQLYTGGRAGVYGRFEGSGFMRTTTARIMRSYVLGHIWTKNKPEDALRYSDFASANGDAAADWALNTLNAKRQIHQATNDLYYQERMRLRTKLTEVGLSHRFAGGQNTVAGALDGERTTAAALVAAMKDMARRDLVQYDELALIAFHYTRGGWDGGSREEQRWDGAPSEYGPIIIPDAYEPAETNDDQAGSFSLLRAHALASIVWQLVVRP